MSIISVLQIQRVVNERLKERYERRKVEVSEENSHHDNERMFFHGSPFVQTIIQRGFDERHAYMGGMFGAGECTYWPLIVSRCLKLPSKSYGLAKILRAISHSNPSTLRIKLHMKHGQGNGRPACLIQSLQNSLLMPCYFIIVD